jgi:hypothetical protein
MSGYAGHIPFTERDIDLFLRQYAQTPALGHQIKEDFLRQAELDIYPQMTDRSDEWARRRLFEPLAWIAYLYRRLIRIACQRRPAPIIAGVVERGALREFSEKVLLERVFRGLRDNKRLNYFNDMYGRSDLTSPKALLDRLGYTDTLLLAMLLQPGQATESWEINKYDGLRHGNVSLPDEAYTSRVNCLLPTSRLDIPKIGPRRWWSAPCFNASNCSDASTKSNSGLTRLGRSWSAFKRTRAAPTIVSV